MGVVFAEVQELCIVCLDCGVAGLAKSRRGMVEAEEEDRYRTFVDLDDLVPELGVHGRRHDGRWMSIIVVEEVRCCGTGVVVEACLMEAQEGDAMACGLILSCRLQGAGDVALCSCYTQDNLGPISVFRLHCSAFFLFCIVLFLAFQ